MGTIAKSLREAIEEVASLPEADQEKIGLGLLSHVEKLRSLRLSIDDGIRSLEAGEGRELDVEDFIARMKERNGDS